MFKNRIMRSVDIYFEEHKEYEKLFGGDAVSLPAYMSDARDCYRHMKSIHHHLANSIAFHLGEFGSLEQIRAVLDIDEKHNVPMHPTYEHLPYPVILITYLANQKEHGSDRRAFLAIDKSQWMDVQNEQIALLPDKPNLRTLDYLIIPLLWEGQGIKSNEIEWIAPLIAALPQITPTSMAVFTSYVHELWETNSPMYLDMLGECMAILWYFLKLLSCKNVVVKETSASGKVSRKRPELTYNVVHIKLPRKVYEHLDLPETVPFHEREKYGFTGQKRGHFKTYTDDAPLFGKHTGTWWWSPIFNIGKSRDYTVTI